MSPLTYLWPPVLEIAVKTGLTGSAMHLGLGGSGLEGLGSGGKKRGGREAERQRGREAERQRGREAERQRDRETERHRDKETERQSDRQKEIVDVLRCVPIRYIFLKTAETETEKLWNY